MLKKTNLFFLFFLILAIYTASSTVLYYFFEINKKKFREENRIYKLSMNLKQKNIVLLHAKLNLRKASFLEITQLTGIGEKLSQKIIDYRKENDIKNIQDLDMVKGIGEKKIQKIINEIEIK